MLRLGDGNLGMKQLAKLIQVLMALHSSRDHAYIEAMVAQILIVSHQKKHNLPTWRMLKDCLSVFNEESGELVFSILARCSRGDSGTNDFEYMDKMYTLLHTYRDVDEDIRDDMHRQGPKSNWRKAVHADDDAVTATRAWLSAYVRKLKFNSATFYDGTVEGFKNSVSASKHQLKMDAVLKGPGCTAAMFLPEKIQADFPKYIQRALSKYSGREWAGQAMGTIWPEFVSPPEDPASAHDSDGVMEDEEAWHAGLEQDAGESDDMDHKHVEDSDVADVDDEDGDIEEIPNDADEQDRLLDKVPQVETKEAAKAMEKRLSKSRDVDQEGKTVSWKQWGQVDIGNLSSQSRHERQKRSKRNISDTHPMVGHQALDKNMKVSQRNGMLTLNNTKAKQSKPVQKQNNHQKTKQHDKRAKTTNHSKKPNQTNKRSKQVDDFEPHTNSAVAQLA
jgi:hypothetical protein